MFHKMNNNTIVNSFKQISETESLDLREKWTA